jgi:peptidyl-prolyl cis-trans isomerase SurA
MSLSAFRQALEKDGVPFERFRDEVRQQIQMQRLREREVDDRIEVSDAEIDQFLAEAKSDGGKRSEYNLAHILVRLPDPGEPGADRQRAQQGGESARRGGRGHRFREDCGQLLGRARRAAGRLDGLAPRGKAARKSSPARSRP